MVPFKEKVFKYGTPKTRIHTIGGTEVSTPRQALPELRALGKRLCPGLGIMDFIASYRNAKQ